MNLSSPLFSISSFSLLSTPGTISTLGDPRLPVFDVKAYTFRKKSRHYVAVKHKNALRIEPIIYLKTSILDSQREIVRNWDFLRFSIGRFRENAIPKKKLSAEGKRRNHWCSDEAEVGSDLEVLTNASTLLDSPVLDSLQKKRDAFGQDT